MDCNLMDNGKIQLYICTTPLKYCVYFTTSILPSCFTPILYRRSTRVDLYVCDCIAIVQLDICTMPLIYRGFYTDAVSSQYYSATVRMRLHRHRSVRHLYYAAKLLCVFYYEHWY